MNNQNGLLKLILIIVFLHAQEVFGQTKLEGRFCTPPSMGGYCITFYGDSLFDYQHWGCMSNTFGKGIYSINKKELILNFKSKDTLSNSFEINDSTCLTKDSVTIQFLILDKKTNQPIAFAIVSINNSTNIIKGIRTNLNGVAYLKLKKSKQVFELRVKDFGHRNFTFKTKLDKCKDLKINLAETSGGTIEDGIIWKYRIKKIEKDALYLHMDKYDVTLIKKKN